MSVRSLRTKAAPSPLALLAGAITLCFPTEAAASADPNVAFLHLNASTTCVALTAVLGLVLIGAGLYIRTLRQRVSVASQEHNRARSQLRSLIENASDVIVVLDDAGVITFNNPSLAKLVNEAPSEIAGRALLDFVHEDDVGRARQFLNAIRAEGSARLECRLVHAGVERSIEAIGKDLTEDKAVGGIVINAWDVTDRNATRASLLEEKERAVVTLRSMGEGVVAADTEGRVLLMNHAAERLTGWSQQEAEARRLSDVVQIAGNREGEPSALSPESQRSLANTIARDYVLTTRSGEERLVAHAMVPIRDGGKAYGVVCVLRDVTEQRRLEREVTRAQQLESLGILAGGIAHDFNNLLAAILGNTSLAREESTDPLVRSLLDEASKAAERAAGLAHQLLTFSRGGAPVRTTAPLHEILMDSATFVLHGSRASLEFAIADDLAPARVDANQISQVIQNLALNASQAMPDGGTVRIVADNVTLPMAGGPRLPAGHYVRVRVSDEGCGIAPEDQDRVFHPFFTTKVSGRGLGLATSHSIIKQHDGQIAVESAVGLGTTFTIHLPASTGATPPPPPSSAHEIALQGRILVMDDNQSVRTALVRILERLGFETVETSEGQEALNQVLQAQRDREPFAAVILDLTIPGGSGGLDILPSLRSVAPTLPAIASSGYATNEVMSNHAAHGFNAILPKPYTLRQVRSVVRSVLNAR